MSRKKEKKIIKQICDEIRKEAYLLTQVQNKESNQKNNLEEPDKDITLKAIDSADEFIQQKNAESMQNNRAFANWVYRIDELEKDVDEQDDRIIDLEDTVKEQKNIIKQLEAELNKKTKDTNKKIAVIFEIIRNMGIAGGMFDRYIKKKNLAKEIQKCANKRIKQNKKCEQLGKFTNNTQWIGDSRR